MAFREFASFATHRTSYISAKLFSNCMTWHMTCFFAEFGAEDMDTGADVDSSKVKVNPSFLRCPCVPHHT